MDMIPLEKSQKHLTTATSTRNDAPEPWQAFGGKVLEKKQQVQPDCIIYCALKSLVLLQGT